MSQRPPIPADREKIEDARTQILTEVYNRINGMIEPSPKGPAEKGWNDACRAMREAILSMRNP